jgi:hypothetical protein
VRFAGSPEYFKEIARQHERNGVPPGAVDHATAETIVHGKDPIDGQMGLFQEYLDNFKVRGYSEDAASNMALEAMETGQEPAQSMRFRGVNGMPIGYDVEAGL